MNSPYKLYFPFALIMATIGLAVFIPGLWSETIYPIDFHRKMMLEVFLNTAIIGFLLSSVPQFCKTQFLSSKETLIPFILILSASLFLSLDLYLVFHFLILSFFIYLLIFLLAQIYTAKQNPPYSFIFIPNALIWGIISEILWCINLLAPQESIDQMARYFYYNGYLLGIVAGVGIRLIPGLLGHVDIVKNQKIVYENKKYFFKSLPMFFKNLVILFNLYLLSYFFVSPYYAEYLKLIWLLLISIFYFKLFSLPHKRSAHSFGVWLSCWCLYLGNVLILIFKEQFSHWAHMIFVGGFLMLILMVMTRVTIAHNKLSFELEKKKWLWFSIVFIILAALTRASAYLIPSSYQNHLAYASILVISAFALLFWRLRSFQ